MEKINLKIDGMSCGHCVAAVKSALENTDGVSVDSVAVGSADLAYDPTVTSADKIRQAVAEAGFTASV